MTLPLTFAAPVGVPTVAALFVEARGMYYGVAGVEPWDAHRDARTYAGPHPVVAHPPCTRWCRLAGLVEARWGHRRGEDGGCFAAALASVRAWGGVLEHPACSDAWVAFDLAAPPRDGGWVRADGVGGFTCHVEQGRYGHRAKKATWLYAYGQSSLPELRWGYVPDRTPAMVSWCRNHSDDDRPRIGKHEASRTPHEFREVLLALARGAAVGCPVRRTA